VTSPLGLASAQGEIDNSGQNPFGNGNYTVTFDQMNLGMNLPLFECYHIVIDGPIGSSFKIYVGANFYSNVAQGWQNEWDPSQTMKLQLGQNIYFYWSVGTGTPEPNVTMYFQEPSPL
jgi:hypothetical protein